MSQQDLLLATGLEKAFLGIVMRFCMTEPVAAYDYETCIQTFEADGMTRDEAIEYFEFNVIGAWVGEQTPMFIESMKLDEAIEIYTQQ